MILKLSEKGGFNIPGGEEVRNAKFNNADECVKACTGGCWAIDFNRKSKKCYRHTSKTACKKLHPHKDVDHYKIRPCSKWLYHMHE